jgi:hypothetical protein
LGWRLKRPKTDPKIIHTDTSTEFWQFRSRQDTDDDGSGCNIVQRGDIVLFDAALSN